jgi:predicted ATPase
VSGERLFASFAPERWDNLPAEISSFVGREEAIGQVVGLFSDHRLVTLSGAPGVGKTRLALRAAAALRDQLRDGVWVVELAALTEPTLVPSALAAALGLREENQQSTPNMIRDRLQQEQALVLLDNCEHLVEACATVIDDLLRSCPGLQVLTTSREPLGLHGEVCWPVLPLTLPESSRMTRGDSSPRSEAHRRVNVAEVLASEAGRLFVERARAVRPTFALTYESAVAVAQICHQLDGIPLALELAAARVGALSPSEISARLDDRFRFLARTGRAPLPRQRTLRASVDWSYELLSEPERVLLRRLAIFRGGWSLQAAEAVCDGVESSEWRLASRTLPDTPLTTHCSSLDVLTSLVEKSLVLVEEQDGRTRYGFLETIRQYSRERLREAGEEEALIGRHRDWFVGFTERAAAYLRTPEQAAWRARLEQDHDNLRAALRRSIQRKEAESGLRLCVALFCFWTDQGYAAEGRVWLEQLLELDAGSQPTAIRAVGLCQAGNLAFEGADLGPARVLAEESLAMARAVGDRQVLHEALTQLGHIARARSDVASARRHYEESLPISRELAQPIDVAVTLNGLGHVATGLGDYDAARSLLEESVALSRSQGHPSEVIKALNGLGRLAYVQGDLEEATGRFAEALPLAQRIKHSRSTANSLEGFATVATARGQPERSLRLAGAAAAVRNATGSPRWPIRAASLERGLAPARQMLGEARSAEVFHVRPSGNLTIRDVSNRLGGTGAAAAVAGGGVWAEGPLTIERASIRQNHQELGAGVSIENSAVIRDSTINGNEATFGAGIFIETTSAHTVLIENSTISTNVAAVYGGVIYFDVNDPNAFVTLNNVTVAYNSAIQSGGGVVKGPAANLFLRNTIVASNTAPSNPNCLGAISSQGHNLVFGVADTCNFGDNVTTDPKLLTLDEYGGPTPTHALGSGSAALDKGSPAVAGSGGNACAAVDQRGLPRTLDGDGDGIVRCDIGAVEGGHWYAVDTTNDGLAGLQVCDASPSNGNCSLRGAISKANTAAAATPGTAAVITLPALGLPYRLTLPGAHDDLNATGDLDIRADVTIAGGGANTTIVEAGPSIAAAIDRVFHVFSNASSTRLKLQDLTVQHGRPGDGGGGIFADRPLSLLRVWVRANAAQFGGGIGFGTNSGFGTIAESTISDNGTVLSGAGIHLFDGGNVTITNTTITRNVAPQFGGGLALENLGTTVVLANVTLAGNQAMTGGGLWTAGTVSIRNTIIAGNTFGSGGTNPNCGGSGTPISQGCNLIFGGGPAASRRGRTSRTGLSIHGSSRWRSMAGRPRRWRSGQARRRSMPATRRRPAVVGQPVGRPISGARRGRSMATRWVVHDATSVPTRQQPARLDQRLLPGWRLGSRGGSRSPSRPEPATSPSCGCTRFRRATSSSTLARGIRVSTS